MANKTRKNAVIFACDHNYIWPALLAANAISDHAKVKDFDIRIFSATHIPDQFSDFARPGIEAEVLSMDGFTVETGITDRYSMATFLRLFALEKIQDDYDRILYLDADIAVRHGDVDIFWTTDLGERPVAAVRDWFNWGKIKPVNQRYMNSLGISQDTGGYFNSGFLLVDAAKWRQENLSDQVRRFLVDQPELCRFHDQSALNYILKSRWAEVSPLWNWQTRVLHHILMIETRDPHIVHFNARRKPWRDRERIINVAFKDPLIHLAKQVGWNAFDDEYSLGPMRVRKEKVRAIETAELYASLPEYLDQIWPYLSRTDFIDTNPGESPTDLKTYSAIQASSKTD